MRYLVILILIFGLAGCAHLNLDENLQRISNSIDSVSIEYDKHDDAINVSAKIKPFEKEKEKKSNSWWKIW